jgi:hypothetical protein
MNIASLSASFIVLALALVIASRPKTRHATKRQSFHMLLGAQAISMIQTSSSMCAHLSSNQLHMLMMMNQFDSLESLLTGPTGWCQASAVLGIFSSTRRLTLWRHFDYAYSSLFQIILSILSSLSSPSTYNLCFVITYGLVASQSGILRLPLCCHSSSVFQAVSSLSDQLLPIC